MEFVLAAFDIPPDSSVLLVDLDNWKPVSGTVLFAIDCTGFGVVDCGLTDLGVTTVFEAATFFFSVTRIARSLRFRPINPEKTETVTSTHPALSSFPAQFPNSNRSVPVVLV